MTNTIHPMKEKGKKAKTEINFNRAGKGVVKTSLFDLQVEVKKNGSLYNIYVDGRKVHSTNTADYSWLWLKDYLSIVN